MLYKKSPELINPEYKTYCILTIFILRLQLHQLSILITETLYPFACFISF